LTGARWKGYFPHVRNDVRVLRTRQGLSQAELGAELGVSRQTVNAIEADRYSPSLPLAIAIARFFGCTVEEVFHAEPS
jgi:putative transcriptional regulator